MQNIDQIILIQKILKYLINLQMKLTEIIYKSLLIRDFLKYTVDFIENPIDEKLYPIPPFKISNNIKLIIIGQDPTIRNKEQRKLIDFTLNLDKEGSLKSFINKDICKPLSISIENIYATNLFKYFYSEPPADIPEILKEHLEPNLKLLNDELSDYPDVPIITLGEPVLKLLVEDKLPKKMIYYWDYDEDTKITKGDFQFSGSGENHLKRIFFPFPHQPSRRKEFYKDTFEQYLNFMKEKIN